MYNGKRESTGYFRDVAKFFDPDWNDAVDSARIFCAWHVMKVNVNTAVIYLLNQECREDNPAAWDAGLQFIEAHKGDKSVAFEYAADAFLRRLG